MVGSDRIRPGPWVIAGDGRRSGTDATVLEPGSRYIVAVESAVEEEVLNLLRG